MASGNINLINLTNASYPVHQVTVDLEFLNEPSSNCYIDIALYFTRMKKILCKNENILTVKIPSSYREFS